MDVITEEARNLSQIFASRCIEIIVTETTITLAISLLGLLLNIFVFYTACKKLHVESLPHMYILSYCLADIIFLGIVMPFSLAALIQSHWETPQVTCVIQGFGVIALGALTVLITTLTAIDRFFAMTSPGIYARIFKGKFVCIMIIVCWLISAAIPLPYFFEGTLKFHPGFAYCKADVKEENYLTASILQLHVVVIPLFIISVCLCKAKLKMNRNNSQQQMIGVQTQLCGNEVDATRLFAAITLGILICCLPTFACDLSVAFLGRFSLPRSVYLFSSFCIASISWVRPLIVAVVDDDYKSVMQTILCCCKPDEPPREPPSRTPSMRSEVGPMVEFSMPYLKTTKYIRYNENGEGVMDIWESQSVA